MQNLFQPRLPYRSHFLLFIQSALETFGGERNSFSLPYLELASGDMPPFTPSLVTSLSPPLLVVPRYYGN